MRHSLLVFPACTTTVHDVKVMGVERCLHFVTATPTAAPFYPKSRVARS